MPARLARRTDDEPQIVEDLDERALAEQTAAVRSASSQQLHQPTRPHVTIPPNAWGEPQLRPAAQRRLQTALRKHTWESPMSAERTQSVLLLEAALRALGLDVERSMTTHTYTRSVVIVPIPAVASVTRLSAGTDHPLDIDVFALRPAPSAELTMVRLERLEQQNLPTARALLRAFAAALPRPPWRFTLRQRLQPGTGLLDPTYRTARLQFEALLGDDVR